MKKFIIAFLPFILTCLQEIKAQTIYHNDWIDFNKNGKKDIFEDKNKSIDKRVENLLKQMTIEEKEGQLLTGLGWLMYERKGNEILITDELKKVMLNSPMGGLWGFMRADPWSEKNLVNGLNPQIAPKAVNKMQKYVIENTRLGIPLLLSEECMHGQMSIGATVFPTAIGQASTWNTELIQEMAKTIAFETRTQGAHIGYGPILDVARDARWSRVEETFGEDSYLIGSMGEAVVRGFQGKDLKNDKSIISTLKHFAAYGWTEGGHNAASANIGNRQLEEIILPPFKRAIDAGALSVMTSYNEIDGIPCSSNKFLINEILKNRWHFNGFVVSDLHSIAGLIGHGVAENKKDATRLSFNSGIDVDLSATDYKGNIIDLYKEGKINIKDIDNSVRRVLKTKFILGLFDSPFVEENPKPFPSSHKELAREVARQSITLLKNSNNILPLRKDNIKIALIGPNADNIYNMLGDYTAPQYEKDIITVKKGFEAKLNDKSILHYSKGCAIRDLDTSDFQNALNLAQNSDIVVMVMGGSSARDFSSKFEITGAARVSNTSTSDMECGEGYDRSTLDLLGKQEELLKRVKELGKPIILVLINGRPLILNWADSNCDAIVEAWYPGMEGGNAIADIIFGDYNPSGRLPISIPRSVGQLPVYYNTKRLSNRSNYLEEKGTPLFPFGFGLSYTKFKYEDIKITKQGNASKVNVRVEVSIKNEGKRDGDEVVQVYVKDIISSFTTPEKQLRAFKKVNIKKGETKNIVFDLGNEAFELLKENGKFEIEEGRFKIMVGSSSDNTPLEQEIEINK